MQRSVVAKDGSNHLLFRNSRRTLQLRIRGADISEPIHLFIEAIVAPDDLNMLFDTFESFNRLHVEAKKSTASRLQISRSERLQFVLRILDGRLAGASYREIAIVLFGRSRVERDWDQSDNHLKNRIRRAAQRGKFLMEGGYRDFLS